MYKDRFLHTMTRLKVSNTNRFNILASKIALGIIIGLMQTLVVYIVSTKLLHVNWGDNLTYIMLVLISFIIFSSVLGIFISMIFHNQKTAYTVNNILIIIMGFLGGSYVPICLVKSSNIALLGLHYNMETKYYIISILISLSLSLIMLIVGNFISKQRVGGNFD